MFNKAELEKVVDPKSTFYVRVEDGSRKWIPVVSPDGLDLTDQPSKKYGVLIAEVSMGLELGGTITFTEHKTTTGILRSVAAGLEKERIHKEGLLRVLTDVKSAEVDPQDLVPFRSTILLGHGEAIGEILEVAYVRPWMFIAFAR